MMKSIRMRTLIALMVSVVAISVGAASFTGAFPFSASSPSPSPINCEVTNPLTDTYLAKWKAAHKAKRYHITVIDLATDCTYQASDTSSSHAMASTAKVMIAVGVLERVDSGTLTYSSVHKDLHEMITVSSNTAAVRLLRRMGGRPMMQKVINQFGLTHTFTAKSFGITRTTSDDQARLLRAVLVDGTQYLSPKSSSRIRSLMRSVTPSQRWGAGHGLPAGYTAAVKNGWYHTSPGDLPPVNRSRVNTIGVVYDPQGQPRRILTGYSDMWRSDKRGIAAWNSLSDHVADVLTATP